VAPHVPREKLSKAHNCPAPELDTMSLMGRSCDRYEVKSSRNVLSLRTSVSWSIFTFEKREKRELNFNYNSEFDLLSCNIRQTFFEKVNYENSRPDSRVQVVGLAFSAASCLSSLPQSLEPFMTPAALLCKLIDGDIVHRLSRAADVWIH
jgi:hypothetical protein